MKLEEAYIILGVTSTSTESEIKSAYKKLALKTHPDKNKNDPEAHKKFLQISEAYKRVTDPDSFKDEENDEVDEEEMEAMFNMMFSEMMGFSNGSIPIDMFDMMEMMMNQGTDDGDFVFTMGGMNGDMDDIALASMMFGGGIHGSNFMNSNFEIDDEDDEDDEDDIGISQANLGAFLMDELLRSENKHSKGLHSMKSSKKNSEKKNNQSASPKKKSVPKKGKDSKKMNQKENDREDGDNWETDDSKEARKRKNGKKKINGKVSSMDNYFDDMDDDDEVEEDEDDDDDESFDEEDEEALIAAMMNQMAGELGLFNTIKKPRTKSKGMSMDDRSSLMYLSFDDHLDHDEYARTHRQSIPKKIKKRNKLRMSPEKKDLASKQKSGKEEQKAEINSRSNSVAENKVPTSNKSSSSGKDLNQSLNPRSSKMHEESSNVCVGDKVIVQGRHRGTVAFVGEVHYSKGIHVGVIMDDPSAGKNNGFIKGVQYFDCPGKLKGLMVMQSDVKKI